MYLLQCHCIFYSEVDAEDPCSECSDNATCEDGECTCKEGFKGDGKTCEGNIDRYV